MLLDYRPTRSLFSFPPKIKSSPPIPANHHKKSDCFLLELLENSELCRNQGEGNYPEPKQLWILVPASVGLTPGVLLSLWGVQIYKSLALHLLWRIEGLSLSLQSSPSCYTWQRSLPGLPRFWKKPLFSRSTVMVLSLPLFWFSSTSGYGHGCPWLWGSLLINLSWRVTVC